ncbi:hypothetical protein ALO44_200172 [Pseudomonas syringae pv. tagetis]|uniref:Conjugal transfer protein n=1 Tax=Pseudomonas syringae pv. tagetis TaxID=129140 RepID=A0A0Q0CC93_9PSED|nr:hypothetical protein ALO44_200172 [Pseudomonas syringae pv. tagetis]
MFTRRLLRNGSTGCCASPQLLTITSGIRNSSRIPLVAFITSSHSSSVTALAWLATSASRLILPPAQAWMKGKSTIFHNQ